MQLQRTIKRRILIVDDEESFARMVKLALEKTGLYEVEIETDPRKAVATTHRVRPDLILLDLILGRVDGGTVAAHLHKGRGGARIPIIFLTASIFSKEQPVGGLESGGFRFLAKPVSLQTLLQTIDMYFPSTPDVLIHRKASTASIRPV